MTWNNLADSRVNVTAWQNGDDGTVTVVVGNQNAILTERQRRELATYLLNGLGVRIVNEQIYESLKDDERWRIAVENWGVDNWAGYEEAMKEYYGEDTDE